MKPITVITANTTTMICESWAPVPSPKRVRIHSAPVITLDRRSHTARKIIRNTWFQTGQTHGSQALFRP